mgnify:CR=1 FL=1
MLSRHFLRAKALQTIYAYYTSGEQMLSRADKSFDYNVNRLNELGAYQLAALEKAIEAGRQVIEDGLHKHLPTQEDLNPNYRLVDNPFLTTLFENFDFRQQTEKYSFPWEENADIMRKIYIGFKETDNYKEHMKAEPYGFEEQQRLALDFFKFIINFDAFRDLFNERSLLWEDDFDQVAQYNFGMLKSFVENELDAATHLPTMNDPREARDVEAYEFARSLVMTTVQHIDENEALIRKHLLNWEFDRVALMDILLINMAIAEFTECPSIPERVTVDEYIELSKEFSTEKSKIFINGILDKLVVELRSQGRVNKSGRGLYIPDLDDNWPN